MLGFRGAGTDSGGAGGGRSRRARGREAKGFLPAGGPSPAGAPLAADKAAETGWRRGTGRRRSGLRNQLASWISAVGRVAAATLEGLAGSGVAAGGFDPSDDLGE